jgi:hypothetical protein
MNVRTTLLIFRWIRFKVFKQFENIHSPQKFLRAKQNIRAQIGQRDKIVQGFLFGGRYFSQMMESSRAEGCAKRISTRINTGRIGV